MKQYVEYLKQWAKANKTPLIVGAVVGLLVGIIIF